MEKSKPGENDAHTQEKYEHDMTIFRHNLLTIAHKWKHREDIIVGLHNILELPAKSLIDFDTEFNQNRITRQIFNMLNSATYILSIPVYWLKIKKVFKALGEINNLKHLAMENSFIDYDKYPPNYFDCLKHIFRPISSSKIVSPAENSDNELFD